MERESTSISHSVVVSVRFVILNTIKVVVSNFFVIFTKPLINDDTESIDLKKLSIDVPESSTSFIYNFVISPTVALSNDTFPEPPLVEPTLLNE